MSTKWLIGLATLWMICTITSLFLEAQQYGTGQLTTLYALLSPDFPSLSNPIGLIIAVISVAPEYLDYLWDLLWWNYSFFTGGWEIVKYVFFFPLSVGLVVSLILAFVRGVGSD